MSKHPLPKVDLASDFAQGTTVLAESIEGASTCDLGVSHAGPFFTVTALAILLGTGTRRKDQKRCVTRKILGRFCLDCANRVEFRIGTAEFRPLGHEHLKSEEADDN
jgi:hypothetical protein